MFMLSLRRSQDSSHVCATRSLWLGFGGKHPSRIPKQQRFHTVQVPNIPYLCTHGGVGLKIRVGKGVLGALLSEARERDRQLHNVRSLLVTH